MSNLPYRNNWTIGIIGFIIAFQAVFILFNAFHINRLEEKVGNLQKELGIHKDLIKKKNDK